LVLALAIVGGLVILFPILVAFGAPITTHIPETVLTALHVALLAGFPLVWKCGVDSAKWREVVAMQAGVDEAIGGAMGACVGAWLGAVPIPLGEYFYLFFLCTVFKPEYMGI
jgi:phosphatidylinositol glycan class F